MSTQVFALVVVFFPLLCLCLIKATFYIMGIIKEVPYGRTLTPNRM